MPRTHPPQFPQSTTSTQSPTFHPQNQCSPPTPPYPNPTSIPKCQKQPYVFACPRPPLFPLIHSLINPHFQAPTPPNELRSHTTHPHPSHATHRNAHSARQRHRCSRGGAANAFESGKSRGAGEAVFEREGHGGAVGGDEEVGC